MLTNWVMTPSPADPTLSVQQKYVYPVAPRHQDPKEDRLGSLPALSPAFTLVELLVVVAIILILSALSFPVINTVRNSANNAKCVGNLKMIGGGLLCYAAEHEGSLMPAMIVPSPDLTDLNYQWYQALDDGGYMGAAPHMGHPTNHPAWQECPSKVFPPTAPPSRHNVGYGWNWWAGTYSSVGGMPVGDGGFGYSLNPPYDQGWGCNSKLANVTKPSRTIIVGDSLDLANATQVWMNSHLYPPPTPGASSSGYASSNYRASRHSGHGNYLMVDGHVEALPPTMDASYFKRNQ